MKRSEQIPKYGTPLRSQLVTLVSEFPGYQQGISKGFPLFTSEELNGFKEHYKDGLTWEDIDGILSRKGIFFKKATFRKYIQEENISKAIGYKNTEQGRVALFPADTIAHINFIQYYYKVLDGEHVDNLLEILKGKHMTYLEAIESQVDFNNLYASIFDYICGYDNAAADAIEKALECRPDDRDKFLKMLNDIYDKFNNTIRKDIDKLVSLLKKKSLSVLETIGDKKEFQDEQN